VLSAEIWNYKTIKHLKINVDGFASLVGPNVIGKSAVLGAIESCLKNSMDKEAVRRGETYSEVRFIHDKSGLDVFWHYEEGGTYYVINGQEYTKLNGAVPPPLLEKGFGPFTSGDDKVYLWHSPQFSPLFLVDSGRSGLAVDLLSTIFNVDAVYKANGLCGKDLKEAKSEYRLRRSDLNKEKDYIASLSKFPSIKASAQKIQTIEKHIASKADEALACNQLLTDLKELKDQVVSLANLPGIPVAPSSGPLGMRVSQLSSARGLRDSLNAIKRALISISGVSSLSPPREGVQDALRYSAERLSLGKKMLSDVKALMVSLRSLSGVQKISKAPVCSSDQISTRHTALGEAKRLLGELRMLSASVERAGKSVKTCTPPIPVPVSRLEGLAKVKVLHKDLKALYSSVTDAEDELTELETVERSTTQALSSYDVCPACGNTLSNGAHGHD
jgi:hypothetical protein